MLINVAVRAAVIMANNGFARGRIFCGFGRWGRKQVALHRSLTSLLRVAEMRPVNWRRYCASPRLPRLEDPNLDSSIPSEPNLDGNGLDSGRPDEGILAECGALPPVCLLFALCEGGGSGRWRTGAGRRTGMGVGELQPLIWQLLELTLRPVTPPASLTTEGDAGPFSPLPGVNRTSPSEIPSLASCASGGEVEGKIKSEIVQYRSSHLRVGVEEDVEMVDEEASLASESVVSRAESPAKLLIAQGLAGPGTLVEMAQDLLSPAVGAEARERCARVLYHLWAASPAESKPEVRPVSSLCTNIWILTCIYTMHSGRLPELIFAVACGARRLKP